MYCWQTTPDLHKRRKTTFMLLFSCWCCWKNSMHKSRIIQSATSRDRSGQSATSRDSSRQSGTVRDSQGQSGTVRDSQGQSGTVINSQGQSSDPKIKCEVSKVTYVFYINVAHFICVSTLRRKLRFFYVNVGQKVQQLEVPTFFLRKRRVKWAKKKRRKT
jgi:hypothetical protein